MAARSELTARLGRRMTLFVAGVLMYVLSSGPVLAAAFWLREASGRNEFYWVMLAYYPLLVFGPDSWLSKYIEWWVNLFGTVGPG